MKIGIVNDSKVALRAIQLVVEQEKDISIAWTAEDGAEAVERCRVDRPDMILMDIVMPNVNGVEATRRIMQETPCPILIVTASVGANVGEVFEAMGAGAMDVVATPRLGDAEPRRLLLQKIRGIASLSNMTLAPNIGRSSKIPEGRADKAVLIGSSAGGPAVLVEILSALPVDLDAGVVIVQHVDERFAPELAAWLGANTGLPVQLAEEGNEIRRGSVLISKGGAHLVFGRDGNLHYQDEPKLSYQPSVDVLFESAVKYGPRGMLGILLTGMGRDGAAGLKKLREANFVTVAQDEKSSAIYGMPRAAVEIGAVKEVLSPPEIINRIMTWTKESNR
jgi:two-component system, chemotaxis family, response regulator WspF